MHIFLLFCCISAASSLPYTIPNTQTTSAIQDIYGPVRYCKAEKYKGIEYPKTRACTNAKVPCPDPDNIVGTVVRFCDCDTAKWAAPNTNNCTHKWVSEIQSSIYRGDPAEDITNRMSSNLGNSIKSQLFGGDVTGTVGLSSDVLNLAKSQYGVLTDRNIRQTRTMNFTQSLGDTGDQLLSDKASTVWNDLETWTRVDQASQLLSVLEQSTLLLADNVIDPSQSMQYQNWAMEVEVRQPTLPSPGTMDDQPFGTMTKSAAYSPPDDSAPVQFSSVKNSPIITLPSSSVLQTSSIKQGFSQTQTQQQPQFSPMGATFAMAPPQETILDRTRLHLGYYVFTTFGQLLTDNSHSIINSYVIGAAVNNADRSLNLPSGDPVTLTFFHLQKKGVSNPRCVYWDTANKTWSTNGCVTVISDIDSTQCSCSHLTSFAILMDVSGNVGEYSGSLAAALDVVSTIGCALSIVCLALSLTVFVAFRSLHNVRTTIHANLCFSLLVAELVFVIGMDRTSNQLACSVTAVLLHYFFLASFCWMLLEGYQLYLMLIQVFEPSSTRIFLYYLFSYGFPAVVVAISAGTAWKNYGTDAYCWIDTSTGTIWAFVAPILVVILVNIVFLLIALKVVLSVKSRDRNKTDRIVGWLKGSATLLCLLGTTWIFGFLTAVNGGGGVVFAWIFTILNCAQGVFIFILHVVLNEKVRIVVVRWLRSGVCCLPDTSSAYNSRSYISSRQRIMNMVRTHNSRSDPSTESTDDKEKPLTPKSKTNDWLRRISHLQQTSDDITVSTGSPRLRFQDSLDTSSTAVTPAPITPRNRNESDSSDPRTSHTMEVADEVVLKKTPVKRKKFPLGATEQERGSSHRHAVIVERF